MATCLLSTPTPTRSVCCDPQLPFSHPSLPMTQPWYCLLHPPNPLLAQDCSPETHSVPIPFWNTAIFAGEKSSPTSPSSPDPGTLKVDGRNPYVPSILQGLSLHAQCSPPVLCSNPPPPTPGRPSGQPVISSLLHWEDKSTPRRSAHVGIQLPPNLRAIPWAPPCDGTSVLGVKANPQLWVMGPSPYPVRKLPWQTYSPSTALYHPTSSLQGSHCSFSLHSNPRPLPLLCSPLLGRLPLLSSLLPWNPPTPQSGPHNHKATKEIPSGQPRDVRARKPSGPLLVLVLRQQHAGRTLLSDALCPPGSLPCSSYNRLSVGPVSPVPQASRLEVELAVTPGREEPCMQGEWAHSDSQAGHTEVRTGRVQGGESSHTWARLPGVQQGTGAKDTPSSRWRTP